MKVWGASNLTSACGYNVSGCFKRANPFADDRRGGVEGDGIYVYYTTGGDIWIKTTLNSSQWRSSIAHEIGHLFGLGEAYIHTGTDRNTGYSCNGSIYTTMDAVLCDGQSPTSTDYSDVQSLYYPSLPASSYSYLCYPYACLSWLDVEESNTWGYLDVYRRNCGGGTPSYLGAIWIAEGTGDYNVVITRLYITITMSMVWAMAGQPMKLTGGVNAAAVPAPALDPA